MNAVEQLKEEIARLQKAVTILEGGTGRKGRSKVSPEKRARLSRALKAAWKKRKAKEAK